jgi:hypothetical protein
MVNERELYDIDNVCIVNRNGVYSIKFDCMLEDELLRKKYNMTCEIPLCKLEGKIITEKNLTELINKNNYHSQSVDLELKATCLVADDEIDYCKFTERK